MSEPLTAKQLALHLKTDARTVRKFLRATRGLVGQGRRWSVEGDKKSLVKIEKQFNEWQAQTRIPKSEDHSDEEVIEVEGTEEEGLDDVEFEDLGAEEDLDLDDE